MYTGDTRSSFEEKEYMNADYHTLWDNINNSKTFRANIGIPNSGLIENLKKFIVKNSSQRNNVYFINFVRSIESSIKADNPDLLDNLYMDLESQITIEIERIIDKLVSYIHIKDASNVRY